MKYFGKLFSFFVVLAALGGLAGCASLEDSLTPRRQAENAALKGQVITLASQVMGLSAQAAAKAERAEVAEVSKQVASVAASQKETAGRLADTAKALAEVKGTVGGLNAAIIDLNSRANRADIAIGTKAEKAEVAVVQLKTDKAVVALGKSVNSLSSRVASLRTQLVEVKHITGAGIDEVLVRIEGFPRAQYDTAKGEFISGCSELTDAQKKELEAKVVKVYTDYSIKAIRGLASVEKFVDKKSGKPFAESDQLNRRCASLRAKTIAEYLAQALNDKFTYVGFGATSDFGPPARNRSVEVVLVRDVSKDGVAAPPAVPAPPAPAPAPAPPAVKPPAAPAPAPPSPQK